MESGSVLDLDCALLESKSEVQEPEDMKLEELELELEDLRERVDYRGTRGWEGESATNTEAAACDIPHPAPPQGCGSAQAAEGPGGGRARVRQIPRRRRAMHPTPLPRRAAGV